MLDVIQFISLLFFFISLCVSLAWVFADDKKLFVLPLLILSVHAIVFYLTLWVAKYNGWYEVGELFLGWSSVLRLQSAITISLLGWVGFHVRRKREKALRHFQQMAEKE